MKKWKKRVEPWLVCAFMVAVFIAIVHMFGGEAGSYLGGM